MNNFEKKIQQMAELLKPSLSKFVFTIMSLKSPILDADAKIDSLKNVISKGSI